LVDLKHDLRLCLQLVPEHLEVLWLATKFLSLLKGSWIFHWFLWFMYLL